jgi:addiction module HigA family antidote
MGRALPKQKKLAPITPGETIFEDFLKPLKMNAHQLALALRVPANRIAAIIEGKRAISADTALRLARYFEMTPRFWINLQAQYELRKAELELSEKIEREVRPREKSVA